MQPSLDPVAILAVMQQQDQLYSMCQELGSSRASVLDNSQRPSALRAAMQFHAPGMPSWGDVTCLGVDQGPPYHVLQGKPLTEDDLESLNAAQAAGQTREITERVAEFTSGGDGLPEQDSIPLAQQLQMPLPTISECLAGEGTHNSPGRQGIHNGPQQGSQSSRGSEVSHRPQHDACSPTQSPQQGFQKSPGQDLCNSPEQGPYSSDLEQGFYSSPKQGSYSSPMQSRNLGPDPGMAHASPAAAVTPCSSSLTQISASSPSDVPQPNVGLMETPSQGSRRPRKQGSEAQALSQALSLSAEHESPDQDLLHLEGFDSSPRSHAMMASDILELLAGTHRQSVVPSSGFEQQVYCNLLLSSAMPSLWHSASPVS